MSSEDRKSLGELLSFVSVCVMMKRFVSSSSSKANRSLFLFDFSQAFPYQLKTVRWLKGVGTCQWKKRTSSLVYVFVWCLSKRTRIFCSFFLFELFGCVLVRFVLKSRKNQFIAPNEIQLIFFSRSTKISLNRMMMLP